VVTLLESPVISVGRMFVKKGDRRGFEAKFEEVRGILEGYARPHQVRFGWREDVEDGAEEDEFVLVGGWDSVEQHFAFAESEGFPRYGELRELIARVDLKHYKPLPLE
jgi:heme-degrading monooxygenase HmoA